MKKLINRLKTMFAAEPTWNIISAVSFTATIFILFCFLFPQALPDWTKPYQGHIAAVVFVFSFLSLYLVILDPPFWNKREQNRPTEKPESGPHER